jgi:NOL1/NOP2/fmu family ribosome biogenesis protein
MKIQTLNRKEKRKFEEKLKQDFGITLPRCLLIKSGKNKIRIFTGDFSEHELNIIKGIIRMETTGLYFANIDKNNEIRLSFDSSNIFSATKNILDLNEEQIKEWFKGQDLNIRFKNKGYVLLKYQEKIIGCGKAATDKIINFVPKERRIIK